MKVVLLDLGRTLEHNGVLLPGVVILNTAFGRTGTAAAPFDKGRTATHEVGHYFNLHHIWSGQNLTEPCADSDRVLDTPNQSSSNRDTPTFPRVSCGNGPNGDMFTNTWTTLTTKPCSCFPKARLRRCRRR